MHEATEPDGPRDCASAPYRLFPFGFGLTYSVLDTLPDDLPELERSQ